MIKKSGDLKNETWKEYYFTGEGNIGCGYSSKNCLGNLDLNCAACGKRITLQQQREQIFINKTGKLHFFPNNFNCYHLECVPKRLKEKWLGLKAMYLLER